MRFTAERTVAEIVQGDYRTADVFKKYGINFCCSGKIALADACTNANIDYNNLIDDLETATKDIRLPSGVQFHQWKLNFLIDYIINIHHAYLRQAIPSLEARLANFVETHSRKQPGLVELHEIFQEFSNLMEIHLHHEEEIIFPYIKQIESAHLRNEPYGNLFVRTLRKPLNNIGKEDGIIISLLAQLAHHTNNYTFPSTACTNHQVVFHKLRELHDDVGQHQYLENTILFPKAIQIEQQLLQV
jgi:regulator of cell morphogenesis and NO signaling